MSATSNFEPGDSVLYIPNHARGDTRHPDCEHGIVSSKNGQFVFVRYVKNGQVQNMAAATSPENLVHE